MSEPTPQTLSERMHENVMDVCELIAHGPLNIVGDCKAESEDGTVKAYLHRCRSGKRHAFEFKGPNVEFRVEEEKCLLLIQDAFSRRMRSEVKALRQAMKGGGQ